MRELIEFVVQYGYLVLLLWVFGEQIGLPIPAVPILLACGALAADGRLSVPLSILLAVAASMIADAVWYELGRKRGARVLKFLCRISLEPDSCVRMTENVFTRHGVKSLLVAKFIPGLNTIAPPLAGVVGLKRAKFLIWDLLGTIIWAAAFVGLGFFFSKELQKIVDYSAQLAGVLFWLIVASTVLFIGWKYHQRRSFLRELTVARVSPQELHGLITAGTPVTILDLRHQLDLLPDPQVIPGAIRLTPEELDERHAEIPRDRDVILYCT